MKIGWIGIGRMGLPMVNRLLDANYSLSVWNRTREKAAPLVARGVTVADTSRICGTPDAVFTMLATGKDLCPSASPKTALPRSKRRSALGSLWIAPRLDSRSSRDIRAKLGEAGVEYLAAPVSGNPKCVIAGKLSSVVSGSAEAFDAVKPIIEAYAPSGVAYVGEGELARICKVAHNVLLGTTIANLIEVTLMAQKAGVPRHAFLKFINSSVMGSVFTRYKSPALVNLDWATTLTPALMLKDLDLGLESARKLAVPAPVTAAVREVFQAHIGASGVTPGAERFEQADFAALFETAARGAGVIPESENVQVPSGLEPRARRLNVPFAARESNGPFAYWAWPSAAKPDQPARTEQWRGPAGFKAFRRTSRLRALPPSRPWMRPNRASCAMYAARRASFLRAPGTALKALISRSQSVRSSPSATIMKVGVL